MAKGDNGRMAAVASLVAATVAFGVIPMFLRYFTAFLDAWTVNGVRYSVGALFWLPFLLLLEREPGVQESLVARRSVWRDAVVPSAVNVVGQALFGIAPYYMPASMVGFTMRLSFLFTITFGLAFLPEERPLTRRPAFWSGVVLSLSGALLMFLEKLQGGSGSEGNSLQGVLILVGASAAMGAYAVAVRYYMASYTARESFSVISLYTSASLVGLMFLWGNVGELAGVRLDIWGLLLGSALVGIAFGHVLYYRGIHRLGPVVSSGIMLLTPFVTYLAAALLLGERLGTLELIGGLVVVAGGGLLVVARGQIEDAADEVP